MDRKFYICCRRDCPRRSVDTGRICNFLKLNSWKTTRWIRHSDLIIVYTCGGFQTTEDRSVLTIRQIIAKKKKSAKLVVTGCLIKINPGTLKGLGDFRILEHEELHKLDNIIDADIPYEAVPDANIVSDVQDLAENSPTLKRVIEKIQLNPRSLSKKLFRFVKGKAVNLRRGEGAFPDDIYNLKIAHGCLGKCSYCAIRLATGELKSKPAEKILEELEKGLAKGYNRFVLIAEDTGCYGLDIGTNIVSLLQKIFNVKKDFSLIINDFNINWLIKYYDDLLPFFIKNKHKIEDIRVPLQSGSDRILKLMRRPYRIDDVKRVISDLHARIPDLRIHTHILVGFPGETDEDFEKSRQLLQDFDFESVIVFRYEKRPGTEASLMPAEIPLDIKNKRALALKKPF